MRLHAHHEEPQRRARRLRGLQDHVALHGGRWSGRQCADYFAGTTRQASSNYCIGVDGDVAMSVDEDDRA